MKHFPPKAEYGKRVWSGIATQEQFFELLEKQNGVCAICKRPETALGSHGKLRNLSVDHCHTLNKIRGLLCSRCNRVLGLLEDNPELFETAAAYLRLDYSSAPSPKVHYKLGSPEYSEYLSNRMKGNTHTKGRKWSEEQHHKYRDSRMKKKQTPP